MADTEKPSLGELNAEINRLQELREQLLAGLEAADIEKIQSLDWTQDCSGRLEINLFVVFGTCAYTLHVHGAELPYVSGGRVLILGKDNDGYAMASLIYRNQTVFKSGCFETNSSELMCQLLDSIKLKSLDNSANKGHLSVLLAAEKAVEQCNYNYWMESLPKA